MPGTAASAISHAATSGGDRERDPAESARRRVRHVAGRRQHRGGRDQPERDGEAAATESDRDPQPEGHAAGNGPAQRQREPVQPDREPGEQPELGGSSCARSQMPIEPTSSSTGTQRNERPSSSRSGERRAQQDHDSSSPSASRAASCGASGGAKRRRDRGDRGDERPAVDPRLAGEGGRDELAVRDPEGHAERGRVVGLPRVVSDQSQQHPRSEQSDEPRLLPAAVGRRRRQIGSVGRRRGGWERATMRGGGGRGRGEPGSGGGGWRCGGQPAPVVGRIRGDFGGRGKNQRQPKLPSSGRSPASTAAITSARRRGRRPWSPITLAELVDPTGGVHHLLLAGVERMARRADFEPQRLDDARPGGEGVPAAAGDLDFGVLRMDVGLHGVLSCDSRAGA